MIKETMSSRSNSRSRSGSDAYRSRSRSRPRHRSSSSDRAGSRSASRDRSSDQDRPKSGKRPYVKDDQHSDSSADDKTQETERRSKRLKLIDVTNPFSAFEKQVKNTISLTLKSRLRTP